VFFPVAGARSLSLTVVAGDHCCGALLLLRASSIEVLIQFLPGRELREFCFLAAANLGGCVLSEDLNPNHLTAGKVHDPFTV